MDTPVILHHAQYTPEQLTQFKQSATWKTTDLYQRQLKDLFSVLHPDLHGDTSDTFEKFAREYAAQNPESSGDWVYYPWSGEMIHTIKLSDIVLLRTNRNRELISLAEQATLKSASIAIAGLSVGGGIAAGFAYAGIGAEFHLADFDELETSNLNRVQARLGEVGLPKLQIVARKIWEIDPEARIQGSDQPITGDTIGEFLGGLHPVNIIFDEVDDFKLKIQLRLAAKRLERPLVMMTALGDSVLIDIERYDTQPDTKIFNGLIGDLDEHMLNGEITKDDERRFAAQTVGIQNVPTRALESLIQMGKALVGRPQLGSTVQAEAALGVFVARKILLGEAILSGRYRVDFNDIVELGSDVTDSEQRQTALKTLFNR